MRAFHVERLKGPWESILCHENGHSVKLLKPLFLKLLLRSTRQITLFLNMMPEQERLLWYVRGVLVLMESLNLVKPPFPFH